MRYEVDVVKQIQDTRTFYVNADSPQEAKAMAIETAKHVAWTLNKKPDYYMMSAEEIVQ